MKKQIISIVISFFIFNISYAGGLSAWGKPVLTPHNNTLNCDGTSDIYFCFSYDNYTKQLGDSSDVPFCVAFREFSFCEDYLVAKGLTNYDKDSVFYIINEVHFEVLKFTKEKDFNEALKKMDIPDDWENAGYGLSWGLTIGLIFFFVVVGLIGLVIFFFIRLLVVVICKIFVKKE